MNILLQDYFSRQSAVREFGPEGLTRLQKATVAVVGTGGVGSSAAWFMASLGLGHLTLIDQDLVEATNLHRLLGIDHHALNTPKAEAAAKAVSSQFPWTDTKPVVETLRRENADELLTGADLILDGTDNFWTRQILNRFSIKHAIPYLFTSAIANQGHMSIFEPPETPCLECLLPHLEPNSNESCETLGVTSTITGTVGSLAATEAAKKILKMPSSIRGIMLTIDLLVPDFISSKIIKREDCEACGSNSSEDRAQGRVVMMCGEHTANVLPNRNISINLLSLRDNIPMEKLIASSESVLAFRKDERKVSVFKSGRLLIDGVTNEKSAMKIAAEIWAEILH